MLGKLKKPDQSYLNDTITYWEPEIFRKLLYDTVSRDDQLFILKHLPAACRSGNPEMVRLFLTLGADANPSGGHPLIACCASAPLEAVQMLVKAGADVKNWKDVPPTWIAAKKNRPDVLEFLLKGGAQMDAKEEESGNTALLEAVSADPSQDRLVEILLKHGAQVNVASKNGMTALMKASVMGRVKAAEMLLDKGADVNARFPKNGRTALCMASEVGSVAVAKLLLERGADIDSADDEFGATPLMIACHNNHVPVVKLLLEKKANVNIQSKKGGTALSVATRKGNTEIVKLLRKSGAR
ncbi:MAG: ankyrin repeat domain-containing protein [Thermodesulfobacteriota bacterium]